MTRILSLLSLVALLGLVNSPNGALATPNGGIAARELMAKRHWPGWNSTLTDIVTPSPLPGGPGPATPGGGGGDTTPTPGAPGGGGETPTPGAPGGGGGETPTPSAPGGGGDTATPTPGAPGGGGGETGTPSAPGGDTTAPPATDTTSVVPTDTATVPPSGTGGGGGSSTDTSSTPTFTQSINSNAPTFSQSISPAPTGGSLSTNVTVPTNASGIFYTGGTWGDDDTCDENTKVTRDVGGQMDCSFLGTAIYMSTVVGPFSGIYTATIDNETVVVNAYRNISEPVCDVSWSRWGLENTTHVVTVVFRGASTEAGPAAQGNSSLEITRFTVTTEGTPEAGGASSGAVKVQPAGVFARFGSAIWTAASAIGVVGALWL